MTPFGKILPGAIRSLNPRWGIVLGSGLGALADRAEVIDRISYNDVPGLPASRVEGHAGQLRHRSPGRRPGGVGARTGSSLRGSIRAGGNGGHSLPC